MSSEKKISDLPPVPSLDNAALFEIEQAGVSFKVDFDTVSGAAIKSINADTTSIQLLTEQANKILIADDLVGNHTFTIGTDIVTLTDIQVLLNKTLAFGSNTISGTAAEFNTAVTDDNFAFVSDNLSVFAATTSLQLLGVMSDETGTGLLMFNDTPTILTPTIASFVNAVHSHLNVAGGGTITRAAISDFNHDLLSTQHSDTLAAAVSQGSIILGNVTPAWSELVIGAADNLLISNGTTLAYGKIANANLTSGVFTAITGLGAQTQQLDYGTNKGINLVDPTNPQDAATKNYVDAIAINGVKWKTSARVGSTANIDLTTGGLLTIDGITLVADDRVLVKDQTLGQQNGVYDAKVGTWVRSSDADTSAEILQMAIFIEEGTTNADQGYVLTTDAPIVLDTTVLTYTQFTGLGQITAGAGLTKTGNTLDVGGTTGRISISADAVDIDAAYVGQATITTLGTITTGVWNGTIVAKAFLPATVVYNDQTNIFGDFDQTFKDNRIVIESPNGLTPTTIANLQQTLARTLSIPILTANRNFVVTGEASQIALGTEVTGASTDLSDSASLARNTDNLGFFAATTSLQLLGVISDETGTGLLVFNDTPTILTPTIASFTNAGHTHQNAAGGGQLDSTLALSDTANIAYLNTANVYIAGTRQDFLGLLAGTAGLNVGGIAGNPTTQVNGDIWYNSTSNILFGRINGVNVDLGASGGEVFTWTANHDANGFALLDARFADNVDATKIIDLNLVGMTTGIVGTLDFNFTTAKTITFPDATTTMVGTGIADQLTNTELTSGIFAKITGVGVQTQALDMNTQILQFVDANQTITNSGGNLFYDVAIGQVHLWRVNNSTEMQLSATALDLQSNALITTGAVLITGGTMRIPLSATPTMAVDGDFAIDTTVTDFSHGLLKFFDGEEVGIVSMPIAQFTTPTDGNVVAYNATNDEFELVAAGGGGLWTVLGDYEATVAEGTHTFSFTAVDFDDDSELILIIDLACTATFDLLLRVDGISTSTYNTEGRRIVGGVETLVNTNTQSSFIICPTQLLNANDRTGFSITHIGLTKDGTRNRPLFISHSYGIANGNAQYSGEEETSNASIASIVILTSTSTWKIGTRATLYKVARA